MQSKILTSCLMAGVLITSGLASRAADTNAPAPTPPGANGAPPPQGANGAPPRMRPLPGTAAGPMAVLSEEQRASYQKNMTDKKAEMMELSTKLRAAQQELNEAMFSLKVDENAIREKVMNEAKIETDLVILRAKAFADIQPPLTEEQFEKFKEAAMPRQPMMRPTPPPQTTPSPSTNHSDVGVQPKQ